MPFELIVQDAFTERLPDNGMRVRQVGDHITDPDQVAALSDHIGTVRVWVDEPEPKSVPPEPVAPAAAPTPAPAPAPAPAEPRPAPSPAAKPVNPAPAASPAPVPAAS